MVQVSSSSVMHVDVHPQTLSERLCMSPGQWVETGTLGSYYIILGRMVIAQTYVICFQQYEYHTRRVGLTSVEMQCLWILAGLRPVCDAGHAAPVILISKAV